VNLKFSLIIALLGISIYPVFAQSEETPFLSVTTDDNHYDEGDIIVVSGKVQTVIVDTPIILQAWHEGKLIQAAQFFPAQDGSFSSTIIAQKPLWNKEGEYTVLVSYGGKVSETTITYTPKKEFIETKDTIEVNIPNGGTFDAEYTILGGEVKDMTLEPENFTLHILLNAPDEGTISIKLPREAIDAIKQNGQDEKFIVLIDDIQNPYSETQTNSEFRLISINFEEGDSEIEIIGTFAVPEFGAIVGLIFVIAIVTSIIYSKYKFPIKSQS
jgi:hypothetical protein